MPVERGSRLGPYEIISMLGAGGMGEVWRAIDTRLDRSVAIKILPGEFAQNAQLKVRFEREARTISQLNHPHICTLYDIGHSDGIDYLVMELLEGEALADRIVRGPLPLADVLRYGREIAQALDRAHRQGVVHRDLKPGNIMLTKSGAKLLDFGLSKSMGFSASTGDATQHKPLTQEGTVLGTYQYMAPEQVAGEEADARSDIFALGVVLYEMATGQRAFQGQSRTSLIAAIVGGEPRPLRELQPLTPPSLEHVIAKCLKKEPDERWQSAHDIAGEMLWISEGGSQAGVAAPMASRRRSRERMAWALAGLLALALAIGIPWHLSSQRRALRPFVTDLTPPSGMDFNAAGDEAGPAVISPNGELVVYSVSEGNTHLWLRSLVTGDAKRLNGTRGGTFPFWSPNSRKIGFCTASELKQIDIEGGAPVAITAVNGARGGSWSSDDTILYTPSTLDAIFRVPATGGKPVAVTRMDSSQHTSHRWPSFLPDGKRFLYVATNHQDPTGSANAVYLASTEGGEPRRIMRGVSNAIYQDGNLFFTRDQSLMAQPVNDDIELSGEAVRIAENVLYDGGIWRSAFSLSEDGVLLFHSGVVSQESTLQWVDRKGTVLSQIGGPDNHWDLHLSPDQQKLAVVIGDPLRELWIHDLLRNTRTKLTLVAGDWIGNAVWSPDGGTVYVDVLRQGKFEVVAKRLAGAERSLLTVASPLSASGVTPDGRKLLLEDSRRLWTLSLDPPGKAPEPMDVGPNASAGGFTGSGGAAFGSSISPNGKWIAYESNENGRTDVFIISAADPSVRWQISTTGGWGARWRRDGKEIFYVDLTSRRLIAVALQETEQELQIGTPQPLFPVKLRPVSRNYDVSADGSRFILNTVVPQPSPTIVVVRNWKQRLGR